MRRDRRRSRVAAGIVVVLLLGGCGDTQAPEPIGQQAVRYRHTLRHGEILGRLTLPSFHTTVAIRDGFDQATIDRGPGWYPGSFLPGEGRLVYIAGHHLTHGAPFRYVADLLPGKQVVIATPYATATYTVTDRHTISGRDLAILRSPSREILRLQTSTVPAGPRRILVTATLDTIHARQTSR